MRIIVRCVRYLLVPAVVAGWSLSKFTKFGGTNSVAAQWGRWTMYILPGVFSLVFLLVSIIMLIGGIGSIFNHEGTGTAFILIVISVISFLGFIGLIQGSVYAVAEKEFDRLVHTHLNESIKINDILIVVIISILFILAMLPLYLIRSS